MLRHFAAPFALALAFCPAPSAFAQSADDLTEDEAGQLGLEVLDKIADGIKDEDVEDFVQDVIHKMHKHRDEGGKTESPKPGTALKHGLDDKDLPGLGKYVNEMLAKGLRGKDLAAAIHKEKDRRKEERKREQEARKDAHQEGKDHPDAGPPPGKGGGPPPGKGGGKGK